MLQQIEGIFKRFGYRDEKKGIGTLYVITKTIPLFPEQYTTVETRYDNVAKTEETWYTIVGDASESGCPHFSPGTPVCMEGFFDDHKNVNEKWPFVLTSIKECAGDQSWQIEYLMSGIFPSMTFDEASKIVDATDGDIFSFAKERNAARQISNASGINYTDAEKIVEEISSATSEREVFELCGKFGAPYTFAAKMAKRHGGNAMQYLKKHPYKAGLENGLTFAIIDKIAQSLGHNPRSYERTFYAVREIMKRVSDGGDTWTPGQKFRDHFRALLHRNYEQKSSTGCFADTLYRVGSLEDRIYDLLLASEEENIARQIARLENVPAFEGETDIVPSIEQQCHVAYGRDQKKAFSMVFSKPGVCILTGGPGTGKTSTVKGIIVGFEQIHPMSRVKLCAPTGRAAQRLSESTGLPASTMHRLIELQPYGGKETVGRDASNPLEADLIVVDEVSMADTHLFSLFLSAVATGTTVLLVGDAHQLESVGCGAVLRDLIDDSILRNTLLQEIFRQAADNPIVGNSKKVDSGDTSLVESERFRIFTCDDAAGVAKQTVALVRQLYNPDNPFETHVLCSTKQNAAGTDALNKTFQELYRTQGKSLVYGNTRFYVGDKIMMNTNNYEMNYFNGDIGTVVSVNDGSLTVNIRDENLVITRDLLDHIELCYGMTVHKSQGSEFKNVIISLQKEPVSLLTRNLLYTAITRAKENVYIVSEGSALLDAITNNESTKRNTQLPRFLRTWRLGKKEKQEQQQEQKTA